MYGPVTLPLTETTAPPTVATRAPVDSVYEAILADLLYAEANLPAVQKDLFAFQNERNQEVIWSVQFTTNPLTTGTGNRGHLYFLMEYDVLPGMTRDVANGRPFKRFRPTTFLLNLVLRPIPQTQIDRTSNPYPQNPGY